MAEASIRPPAVAGMFYPADPRVLATQVADFLSNAHPFEHILPPKALVAPHAGYVYSGPVAGSGYAALLPLRDLIRKVVLLGPAHRVGFQGMALPASLSFATPLGQVAVDLEHWRALQGEADVIVDDRPHAQEHCLEVQLPFLQTLFSHFTLTPLLIGDCSDARVAQVLEQLWGGPETLVVISSDLSHYHTYAQAQLGDRVTADQILRLESSLDHHQACGATPVNALLQVARRHHLAPHLLDLRNSGDTAGDRQRVVGYASIGFCEELPHARH